MKPDIPRPANEPFHDFEPGSPERERVKAQMDILLEKELELPLVIGGRRHRTGNFGPCPVPDDNTRSLGSYHKAGTDEAEHAIEVCLEAREGWSRTPWERRARVLLKAADLLSGKYRFKADAITMLVHSKNPLQAEIDIAELADFWRFNAFRAKQIFQDQPVLSPKGARNRIDYRPLEGFVLAIPPFNFISICGNLPTAPALMGNVVVWKPPSSVVYSNYFIMTVLEEAGLPPGVINFIPGDSSVIGERMLRHRQLAGVNFTGSTATLRRIFQTVGQNIANYANYPRIVGESGGKGFVVAHSSADPKAVAVALLRGAFEYQGQKCSAASRAYLPGSLWPKILVGLESGLKSVRTGPVTDMGNFMNAVIDKAAFEKIRRYIALARESGEADVIIGGHSSSERGLFIEPTVILVKNPRFITMEEEIFGPVLSVFVYNDADYIETLKLCNRTSPYALTGSVFVRNRKALELADRYLRDAAGNFYINDKPTGAVVGQQPFGGARASGTNDKAGTAWNLMRWVSPRTIKETLHPAVDFRYPFMD
jgi:1-pyrroline-5-carboxylate dehydrogenase